MPGSLYNHAGWAEEIEEVKASRIAFYNKPKPLTALRPYFYMLA